MDIPSSMKLHRFFASALLIILFSVSRGACASTSSRPISLASFTENNVQVSIDLERDAAGNYLLTGKFTPPEGYHLYSKDIPLNGLHGLGRPTLLELTSNSLMKSTGDLTESVRAREPDFEPKQLLVYPSGPVTLRLPVELPAGNDWVNDEIEVTYMVCSDLQCKRPVEGKIISVRIPSAGAKNY